MAKRLLVPGVILVLFALSDLIRGAWILNPYLQLVVITLAINAILAASLNLVNGYMGEFSVGHAGFMAIGAYMSAVFTTKWLPDFPMLFPVAVVFGGIM